MTQRGHYVVCSSAGDAQHGGVLNEQGEGAGLGQKKQIEIFSGDEAPEKANRTA